MRITFEIDDALVPSIEQHLQTQIRVENDPLTNRQRHVRLFASVPAFLADCLHQVVYQLSEQFPTDEVRNQLIEAQKVRDAIKERARPKLVEVK